MPKKVSSKNDIADIPRSLADPEFEDVRKMLLEYSRPTDKYWKKTCVARFFDGMAEERRGEIAPFCMKWYQYLRKTSPNEYKDRLPSFFPTDATVQHAFLAIKVAVLACGSCSEAQKVFREVGASFVEEAVEKTLRSRKPEWASEFLLFIAKLPRLMHLSSKAYWRTYRQLVKEKIAKPISDEFWVRTMFSCGMTAAGLKNDQGLLESDIWELFEFSSFPGGWSLTSCDNGNGWKNAFVSLIKEGLIDKQRFLDGCFRSISKPFTDHQSKWYVQMLERIPLDEKEMRREQQRFFDLMNHPNPTPRNLGMKVFEKRYKAGLMDDKSALDYIPAILRESVKAKAKVGLAMLDRILDRSATKNRPLSSKAMLAATEGLRHENTDIQKTSLELILKHDGLADTDVAVTVRKITPSLPVSLRKMLPEGKRTIASPNQTTPRQVSATPHYVPIVPVHNFEELLDLATRLVEGFKEIDDVERFLDGLARLGNDKPKDFDSKTAALLARTQKKIETFKTTHPENGSKIELLSGFRPFRGEDILVDIHFAVASWICGEMPHIEMLSEPIDMQWKHRSPEERICTKIMRHGKRIWYDRESTRRPNPGLLILSKRIETVVQNVCSCKTIPLLSSPTHQGGWIDPVVFVQRLVEANTKRIDHAESDKILALTRLMRKNCDKALKSFDKSKPPKSEWTDAVRYALGVEKVKIGKTPHLWIAAARCRTPLGDIPEIEKHFPAHGPDAGIASTYRFEIKEVRHYGKTLFAVPVPPVPNGTIDWPLFPLLALHASPHQDWRERDGLFPWFLSIWPQKLDPAIAVSICSHSQNIDKNYDYGFHYTLKAIAASSPKLQPIAVFALFLGSGMKYPLTHATATDTLIAVIGDGRLTLEQATSAVRELLALNFLTLSRWLKPLKTVAEQSSHHAAFAHELLENIVDSIPSATVGSFLELLLELGLSLERPIVSEQCRKYLQSFIGSGKAAKLAKKLLALAGP